ncbi:hypothetical protein N1851_010668 [Merluccius polli]|uniref:Uncharacterized protein n=1 Tax=Merluccius polli TaxID=89951 RepID=A0AA47MZ74_MERPO|nr:hypothetical protein N1851_010668 [Merluccius polli]
MCNALKRKSPADQKSAKSVKKPRKAEVNYLPPYPAGENEESQEQERIQLLTEVTKRDNSKIQDEFCRITMVHLEPKFMAKLDEYTPKLVNLFQAKSGLRLQAILLKAPTNPNTNVTRAVVLRCLVVYLGESLDDLLKEYDDADGDSVSRDLAVQRMKIYTKTNASEAPDKVGIVVEGMTVLTALGNFSRACSMLLGLTYAVNLAYPKELKYTFEVFQKLLLELDSSKLSPKTAHSPESTTLWDTGHPPQARDRKVNHDCPMRHDCPTPNPHPSSFSPARPCRRFTVVETKIGLFANVYWLARLPPVVLREFTLTRDYTGLWLTG